MLINDLVELGELIRRRRTDHGLSQNELADKVGATRQWVSRLEKGKNEIGTARLLAVLNTLELNLEIRPPRLESAEMAINKGTRAQSLIASETVRALAQMSDESNALEAGRRRILEANLNLLKRRVDTNTETETEIDDAQP